MDERLDGSGWVALGGTVRTGIAGLTALAIFLIDTFTMLQSAVAVLYVLVIVIAEPRATRRGMMLLSAGCMVLSVASFAVNHGPAARLATVLRLGISLAAIGVTATVLIRNHVFRTASAKALSASEARYRTIFETLAVAIWEHDFCDVKSAIDVLRDVGVADFRSYVTDHPHFVVEARRMVRITDVNETALRMMGVPSKQHFFSHLSDFLPEEDESFAACIVAIAEGHPSFETETRVRTADGELLDVIVALSFPPGQQRLDRIQGSVLNVTERKRMERALDATRAELEQAMRAATVGQLSATIAHEVNQPLSAVRSYTVAARRWLSKVPPNTVEALIAIDEVARAAAHAGEVVTGVRKFLTQSIPDRRSVLFDDVVRATVDLMEREIGATGTTMILAYGASDARVSADPILIQQLLINLIGNALQAMESGVGDAAITIRTERMGAVVSVAVIDNGHGFSGQAIDKAFDPFFTTRDGGTGLGLAMCRSIADAHDGTLQIRQEEGRGAAVEFRLPVLPPAS